MSDPKTLREKIARTNEQLYEVIPYTGRDTLEEINVYLDKIHGIRAPIIFDGSGLTADPRVLEHVKSEIAKAFAHPEEREQLLDQLRHGQFYFDIITGLLVERLARETGLRYRNEILGIDRKIFLNTAVTTMPVGNDKEGDIFFNSIGIMFFDREEKRSAMDHETAHQLLGHTGDDLPDDRRQLEFDADYVGSLVGKNPHGMSKLNAKQMAAGYGMGNAGVQLEEQVEQVAAILYKQMGKKPGEDSALDAKLETTLAMIRQNLENQSRWIYPTFPERIEETEALARQLKYQDELLRLSPDYENQKDDIWRERVRQAIEARQLRNPQKD